MPNSKFTAAQAAQKWPARRPKGTRGFTAAQAAQKKHGGKCPADLAFTAAQAAQKMSAAPQYVRK